jgi:hypothetical protein
MTFIGFTTPSAPGAASKDGVGPGIVKPSTVSGLGSHETEALFFSLGPFGDRSNLYEKPERRKIRSLVLLWR